MRGWMKCKWARESYSKESRQLFCTLYEIIIIIDKIVKLLLGKKRYFLYKYFVIKRADYIENWNHILFLCFFFSKNSLIQGKRMLILFVSIYLWFLGDVIIFIAIQLMIVFVHKNDLSFPKIEHHIQLLNIICSTKHLTTPNTYCW